MTSLPMNARSELIRRRSPGVDRLRKSFDGFVVETSRRFHAAVPASNQPALRPTRGSGLGFVVPTVMFGVGAALEEEDDDLVEAQAAAIAGTASERRERCLTGGIGNRESKLREAGSESRGLS